MWNRRTGLDDIRHVPPTTQLGFETARLAAGCKELVWLNPLLRFDRFEPRAAGIRAMLPHVDGFLPVHNLQSLEHLLEVLASGAVRPG